jgi:hypothetical protein
MNVHGYPLGMDSSKIRVFEQADEVRCRAKVQYYTMTATGMMEQTFAGLLEGKNGGRLEAEISL